MGLKFIRFTFVYLLVLPYLKRMLKRHQQGNVHPCLITPSLLNIIFLFVPQVDGGDREDEVYIWFTKTIATLDRSLQIWRAVL